MRLMMAGTEIVPKVPLHMKFQFASCKDGGMEAASRSTRAPTHKALVED